MISGVLGGAFGVTAAASEGAGEMTLCCALFCCCCASSPSLPLLLMVVSVSGGGSGASEGGISTRGRRVKMLLPSGITLTVMK